MQLADGVAGSLFAATAALLGASAGPSIAQEVDRTWLVDTSVSYYGETDRVKDGSFDALVKRRFSLGTLSLRLAVDTLTGASASGAAPARVPQTFTSPSGGSSYAIGARSTPLDPSFHDTRFAFELVGSRPVGSHGDADVGLSFSTEYDYLHLGAEGRYRHAFAERNTTLSFGAAFGRDTVKPVGGAPTPFAAMLPESGRRRDDDRLSKNVVDALVGVTQVLGKRTIAELDLSYSRSSGYLTDPYKVLSVVDAATGDLVPGPGLPGLYRYESRPGTRTKQSVFAEVKHRLGRPILDVSYRYLRDDWGIRSHTADLRIRQPIGADWYVQPHLRWYTQTAADFYRPYLRDGDPLPDHASADYRLGSFDALTFGAKVGTFFAGHELSLRVEYYRQAGRAPPGAAFGSLAGLDLFPKVSALIVQTEFHF